MILDALALSLGVFFITNFAKFLVTARILAPMKMTVVAVLSLAGALALAWNDGWAGVLLLWLAVVGLSSLVHATHKLISAAADERRAATLNSRARRR